LNMSAAPQKVIFNLSKQGFGRSALKTLIASPTTSTKGDEVNLEPFGLLIAELN
jgi:hypothetical protein